MRYGYWSLLWVGILVSFCTAQEFDVGADLVSRYVWRGTDFGNTAAAQPFISFSNGPVEIGAWGSYSLTPTAGGYENDLYITFSQGPLSVTLTDYYFPNMAAGVDEFFEFSEDSTGSSYHFLEAAVGFTNGPLSLLAGVFLTNDDDNSVYLEGSYEAFNKDDVSASVIVGTGNGIYSIEDPGDDDSFNLVNVGLSVSKGMFTGSYLVNPDRKISFLVIGVSL